MFSHCQVTIIYRVAADARRLSLHPNLSNTIILLNANAKIWRVCAPRCSCGRSYRTCLQKSTTRYQLLQAARPNDATTILFPGIEALTSEGIDVIVFAENDQLYQHQN